MRRIILVLTILLLACRAITLLSPFPPSLTPTVTPSSSPLTPTPPPPTSSPLPLTPPPPTFTAPPPAGFAVNFHPDGDLYVSDQVSLEVIPPPYTRLDNASIQVQVDAPSGARLGPTKFEPFGIGGRTQATMLWVWDTRGLEPGSHTLAFTVQPSGPTWTETVTLQPESAVPAPEPRAHWAIARSKCCVLNYITGTAAERDLPSLLTQADEQANDAIQHMGIDFSAPITVTLVPRLLGQGGFANGEITVSYLDRNYGSSNFTLILHHEMIHTLDGRLGGELRPTLLQEGLAVYMSGGHYKPEQQLPRAAALLDTSNGGLGWYLPLIPLTDNFYISQHEIGYIEASVLVEYMVDTWGWQAFSAFYRDIHPQSNGSQAQAIDVALKKHFGLPYAELEQKFLEALHHQTITNQTRDDVRLTVYYFDTLRRYQQALDPSAYFQNAWLMDNKQMRQRGIVADYLRHPSASDSLALETLLISAWGELNAGSYSEAQVTLAAVNAVLDEMNQGIPNPFTIDPLAADYDAIVQILGSHGYQVQRIEVQGDTAQAWVSQASPELIELKLSRVDGEWELDGYARIMTVQVCWEVEVARAA